MLACCGIINFDISFFRGIIGCACEGFEKIKCLRKRLSKTECRVGTILKLMILSFQIGVCRVGDYPRNVV